MAHDKENQRHGNQPRLELIDLKEGERRPDMAVYALDRAGRTLEVAEVDDDGRFRISDKVLDTAHKVVVGPRTKDIATVAREVLSTYRASQFKMLLAERGVVEIPRAEWYRWWWLKVCVNGAVSHCYPSPWLIAGFARQAVEVPLALELADDAAIARPRPRTVFPWQCEPVCDGVVEVYRRVCCEWPWRIEDPRLDELREWLEHRVPHFPPDKWPPQPGPDPAPFEDFPFFQQGALDERILNAQRDLYALRTLPPEAIPAYVTARPYLHYRRKCSDATRVGEGSIHPDGRFHICWREFPRLLLANCHYEYAFVVKQVIAGVVVTIYDGLGAGQWFGPGEDIRLVSYHPLAQGCRHNEFPETGAYVLLQDIGMAGSYRLKTPDATGWDRVATPQYNDGLADPAASPGDAIGRYLDRNWGGRLDLRYHFSEPMKAVGAKYYRLSVAESDANGNPTGMRKVVVPKAWRYYEIVAGDPVVKAVALGPNSVGGHDDLYEIPYDADRDWQSGQYHGILDTTEYGNGRHLLTVEVFAADGKLIRPAGTPDPGGSEERGFTFRRWAVELGPTVEVPFAALTHMLWWDNRKAVAEIVDFRVNGAPNTQECQFLEGYDATLFTVGYRAYHPEPLFQYDHRLWWRRGLGGSSDTLTSPHPNPFNVGIPPAPPHESGWATFGHMLDAPNHDKCSFSINLHVNVKTFNGRGTLDALDAWDQAALALEIVP